MPPKHHIQIIDSDDEDLGTPHSSSEIDDESHSEAEPPKKKLRSSKTSRSPDADQSDDDAAEEAKIRRATKALDKLKAKRAKKAGKKSQLAAERISEEHAESEEEQNPPLMSGSIHVHPSISAAPKAKPTQLRRAGAAAPPKPVPNFAAKTLKSVPSSKSTSRKVVSDEETRLPSRPDDDVNASCDDNAFNGPGPTVAPTSRISSTASSSTVRTSAVEVRRTGSAATSCRTNGSTTAPTAEQVPGTEDESPRKVPVIRQGVNHNPKNPKASDYEDTVKALMIRAAKEYEVRVCTVNPFPDSAMRVVWAKKCWENACGVVDESYEITDAIICYMGKRATRIRGAAITRVRERVAATFGFENKKDPKTIGKNQQLSRKLKKDDAFLHKNMDDLSGFAEGKIIYECLQAAWFSKKNGHGAMFDHYFKPVKLVTLALIMALIDFTLDNWSTGELVEAELNEDDLSPRYKLFKGKVDDWNKINQGFSTKRRHKLYQRAMRDVGIVPEKEAKAGLDEETRKRIQTELANRTGDTDSEGEEDATQPANENERNGEDEVGNGGVNEAADDE